MPHPPPKELITAISRNLKPTYVHQAEGESGWCFDHIALRIDDEGRLFICDVFVGFAEQFDAELLSMLIFAACLEWRKRFN